MLEPHVNHKQDNRNLIIALVVSVVVIVGFEFYAGRFSSEAVPQQVEMPSSQPAQKENISIQDGIVLPGAPERLTAAASRSPDGSVSASGDAQIAATKRISFENSVLRGSIALKGGRVDRLSLPSHKIDMEEGQPVTLFRSSGEEAHFFDAGWLGEGIAGPDGNTLWQSSGKKLIPGKPLELTWQNRDGQFFTRIFKVLPERYVIEVTDRVINNGNQSVQLTNYAQIHKTGIQNGDSRFEQSSWYNYFGPEGVADDLKIEADYEDLRKEPVRVEGRDGWAGTSSRYFLAALNPSQSQDYVFQYRHSSVRGKDFFTTMIQPQAYQLNPGARAEVTYHLYAGPKVIAELEAEGHQLTRAVDYGWFHIIARPLFDLVMWLYSWAGNLGIAIILATVILKAILFPLANKSYVAMAKMKKLQPRMEKLKEQHADNREKFAAELMGLYREEKVNPMSGCWPILIQIPIFFAFYKVILVSFEFRHTPFFGWITDLSAKDPYYVLPILMGLSMVVQMRLNPTPADPVQQQVMKWMPIIFTFLFLMFPSGLVLYWLTNNVLSIGQQWFIMKRANALS